MKSILTFTLLSSSLLFASSLKQTAIDAGLVAITSQSIQQFSPEKVELGKKLYFDPRLSKSGIISCNSCHNLAEGGDDGVEASIGHGWTPNPHHINAPTVYNAVFFEKQFWDGRSPNLEDQAQGPIQATPEMAATQEHVTKVVNSMPAYVQEFQQAYGKAVTINFEKITDTIALFERTLVTPSPYDDFLNGDINALNQAQKDGLKTFIDLGCVSCHNGIALGGSMNMINLFAEYKYMKTGDFKGDANAMVKVPTLRNIKQTAPYFHNGKIWSLKDAIKEMARIQLGKNLTEKETDSIESFLGSLDGRKPVITIPLLPSSTQTTPKPDMN